MTAGKAVALTAISGAAIIAVADAPDWSIEQFAAWLAVMTGTAFIAQLDGSIGKSLSIFLLAVVIVRKGRPAMDKLMKGIGK